MITLDVSDLKCPLPVLKAQKALREMSPGAELLLISTDVAAEKEVPFFCQQAGYTLARHWQEDGRDHFLIRR